MAEPVIKGGGESLNELKGQKVEGKEKDLFFLNLTMFVIRRKSKNFVIQ